MASVQFDPSKWEQEAELQRQLEEIRDNITEQIRLELDSIMERVKEDAISLCPKDTGTLASSISLEEGTISASSGDFYNSSIYAGSPDIVNPKTGVPSSDYAGLVHDGHALRDGSFYGGVPYLIESLLMHEDELNSVVETAMREMGY